MMMDTNQLEPRFAALCNLLTGAASTTLPPSLPTSVMQFAPDALDSGRSELCALTLEQLLALSPGHGAAWQLLGFAYGEAQRIPEAAAAFERAAALRPDDPQTAQARAQANLDAGLPKSHRAEITSLCDSERDSFADIFKSVNVLYDALFNVPFPYTMGLHQRPTDGESHPEWHFHAHFYPPLLRSATVRKFMVGYELLAGPQRDISPEDAAAQLRAAIAEGA